MLGKIKKWLTDEKKDKTEEIQELKKRVT